MIKLAIVVPCYNETPVLEDTTKRLTELLRDLSDRKKITSDSFLLYVDDGSKDGTWDMIRDFFESNSFVTGLKLAGNVGHQNALLAGMLTAVRKADALISIDADLQDDIQVIEEMVDKFENGNDIVYGVRSDRKSDTFFKRTTAQGFYKLMKWMGIKSIYNHADFRLMSKRAVEQLGEYKERNLFLRGIVPLLGYQTDCVYYERKERQAGESKYPLKKMMSFAFDGITSFSTKPMMFIMNMGLLMVAASLCAAVYALISYVTGHVTTGWTSLILSLWFIGGMILFAVGIIGLYIGKIYMEVKERPRYYVETHLEHE